MSYRDLQLPGRAISSTLEDIQRRLSNLEKRARWNGAVQVQNQYSASLNLSTSPTLLELDVDPGTWVAIGFVFIESEYSTFGWSLSLAGNTSVDRDVPANGSPGDKYVASLAYKFEFTAGGTIGLYTFGGPTETGVLADVYATIVVVPT